MRSRRITTTAGMDRDFRRSLGAWQASVVRQNDVDPVTTELVRLRCAHHHQCGT